MSRPLTGIPADQGQSYASIERMTVALREVLGLNELDRFDALHFFDSQVGDMTLVDGNRQIKMVEAVDDCPQEGKTRWDAQAERLEIVLAETTYKMLREDHVRARSTVTHETGHAILHTSQIIQMAGMSLGAHVAFHRDRNPHKACFDTEWQANAFGSSLLMPAAGVSTLVQERGFTIALLAKQYGVSEESATYRLETYRRSLGL